MKLTERGEFDVTVNMRKDAPSVASIAGFSFEVDMENMRCVLKKKMREGESLTTETELSNICYASWLAPEQSDSLRRLEIRLPIFIKEKE